MTGRTAAKTDGSNGPPGGAGDAGRGGRRRVKPAKVTTPWGQSVVVEEVKVAQQAGEKRFSAVVQLLESSGGEVLVRIAYTTDGVTRRGPVTLRRRDVERLNAVLESRPRLAEAFGRGGDAS